MKYQKQYRGRIQLLLEVARSNVSSLIRAGLVRKDIRPPKTRSNITMDIQLPDGD